jgi:hypothetical protein
MENIARRAELRVGRESERERERERERRDAGHFPLDSGDSPVNRSKPESAIEEECEESCGICWISRVNPSKI